MSISPRVAAVFAGEVRSFVEPSVHDSIRRNALDALCANGECDLEVLLCGARGGCNGKWWGRHINLLSVSEAGYRSAAARLVDGLTAIPGPKLDSSCDDSDWALKCGQHEVSRWCRDWSEFNNGSDLERVTAPSDDQLHRRREPPKCASSMTHTLSMEKAPQPGQLWIGLMGMMRWRRCYAFVEQREREVGRQFDWTMVMRFDVAFFKPLPPLSVFATSGHGVHVANNHYGLMSDHWALMPHSASAAYMQAVSQTCCVGCWGSLNDMARAQDSVVSAKMDRISHSLLKKGGVPKQEAVTPEKALFSQMVFNRIKAFPGHIPIVLVRPKPVADGATRVSGHLAECFRQNTCFCGKSASCVPACNANRVADCKAFFASRSSAVEVVATDTVDGVRVQHFSDTYMSALQRSVDANSSARAGAANMAQTIAFAAGAQSKDSCIVFHAQHKSGGNTIAGILREHTKDILGKDDRSSSHKCDVRDWQYSSARCNLPKTLARNARSRPISVYGGYSLSLAHDEKLSHSRCRWFTMVREPVDRLVSSYFHCKLHAKDPLCASSVLSAKSATIEQWAEHWGNYLFRELMLHPDLRPAALEQPSPVEYRDIDQLGVVKLRARLQSLNASSEGRRPELLARLRDRLASQGPARSTHLAAARDDAVWYVHRLAMNGADDPRTAAGAAALRKVVSRLKTTGKASMFDAVGVFERWDDSMRLFDLVIPFQEASMTWRSQTSEHKNSHGSEVWGGDKEAVLRSARESRAVRDALAADLQLYNEVMLPQFESTVSGLAATVSSPRLAVTTWNYARVPKTGSTALLEIMKKDLTACPQLHVDKSHRHTLRQNRMASSSKHRYLAVIRDPALRFASAFAHLKGKWSGLPANASIFSTQASQMLRAIVLSGTPEMLAENLLSEDEARRLLMYERDSAGIDRQGLWARHMVVFWPQSDWVDSQTKVLCYPGFQSAMAQFMRNELPECSIPTAIADAPVQPETRNASMKLRRLMTKLYKKDVALWASNCESASARRSSHHSRGAKQRKATIGGGHDCHAQSQKETPVCMHGRRMPRIYLLGHQKCGTSTVAKDLAASGVVAAFGKKELHTFDELCGFSRMYDQPQLGRCPEYRSLKAPDRSKWQLRYLMGCQATNTLADMTPANIRLVGLPQLLQGLYGSHGRDLGFVLMLRDPMSRMHSAFYQKHFTFKNNVAKRGAKLIDVAKYMSSFAAYVAFVKDAVPSYADANWTAVSLDYRLDDFYRSVYSRSLRPWLDEFKRSQFLIVPMKRVFKSTANRIELLEKIRDQFDAQLDTSPIQSGCAELKTKHHDHPALEQDLPPASLKAFNTLYFQRDVRKLSVLLSRGDGVPILGYSGDSGSSQGVLKYLTSSW